MFFFFLVNPYIAIIGDMKNSKNLDNRKEIQHKLNISLSKINKKYEDDISSKFMITLGDEFQGLLCNGKNVMKIISEIEQHMYPVELRFGVGIGEITTDINKEMAIGADGPGYYNARNAIENIKINERKSKTDVSNVRIEVSGENDHITSMLNVILTLLTSIREFWTERQREIIWDMLIHQDQQKNVACRLKITQSVVQKSLAKGKYYAYKEALDTIDNVLNEIRGKDV